MARTLPVEDQRDRQLLDCRTLEDFEACGIDVHDTGDVDRAISAIERLFKMWEDMLNIDHLARNGGLQHSTNLKARLLLLSDRAEEAINSLLKFAPSYAMPEGSAELAEEDRAIVDDWSRLMDTSVAALAGPAGRARAWGGAAELRIGCDVVRRREHALSNVEAPARMLMERFSEVVDASYAHQWQSGSKPCAKVCDHDEIPLFGGLSRMYLKPSLASKLLRWGDQLVSNYFMELAEMCTNLLHLWAGSTLLAAYLKVWKGQWKDAVLICLEVSERSRTIAGEVAKSHATQFLESMALFNLGYVQIAQKGVSGFLGEVAGEAESPATRRMSAALRDILGVVSGSVSASPPRCGEMCFSCGFKGARNMFSCSKCGQARYCTSACQHDDWKFHKKLCSSYKYLDVPLDNDANNHDRLFSKMDLVEEFEDHGGGDDCMRPGSWPA
mmetsp:Transcript_69489/g.195990  ORF Transcript_69489/g.195990 Transcript_69489/m.195990 type:complete len:442 (-) Transcript_69489:181-1506(-)